MRIVRLAIVIGCLLLEAGVACFGQQCVGFVLELQGKWVSTTDKTALKVGQTLPAGFVGENPDPVDGDHIVIADLHGEVIKTIRCRSAVCRECSPKGGCYDPIHPLPNSVGTPSRGSAILNAIVDLLSAKPDRYSVHRVRGAEGFRSAVLQLEGNTTDVGDLLQDLEPGNYALQLTLLSEGNEHPNVKTLNGQTIWTPGSRADMTVPGIAPGLYEVRYQHGSIVGDAWVLICSGSECRDMAARYAEFKQKTEGWEKNVAPSTIQAYQRACLEYLILGNVRSAK